MAENQVQTLLEGADQLEKALQNARPLENAQALGGGEASNVAFPTAYVLTPEQEKNLVEHASTRLKQIETEMGRNLTRTATWHHAPTSAVPAFETFLGRRQVYEWIYENNCDWRPSVQGGIFEISNLIVPVTRRIVRQMIARAVKFFVGTDPWFAALPEGAGDRGLAEKVERYARFKLDKNKVRESMKQALTLAFVRGECVVKTTHQEKDQIYKKVAKVLVDATGNPILGADNDYITEADAFVPSQDPSGMVVMLLQRDMQTVQPLAPIFMEKLITRRSVIARGPTAEPIYYQDFICPLNSPSVDDADFVAHLYDAPVMYLADLYNKKSIVPDDPNAGLEKLRVAIEQIRLAASESGESKVGAGQARTERGEAIQSKNESNPSLEVAECYLKYDADGDGITEEITLLLDVKNQKAIYYEYTANVTPDGKRPFTVLRINPVDGRWYGIGAVEQFKTSQDFIDLCVNRLNFSQSASGRVTFWRPDATFEGSSNPNLLLNTGGTYTLRPGFASADALSYVTLPDVKNEQIDYMLNYFTQLVQLESGVMNGGDQEFSGLPSSQLATGIRSIDQSGSEMFSQYILDLESPMTQVLERLVVILLDNLDKAEAFNYLEGDAMELITITPDDVKSMRLNVRLLLTRYHGEQMLQSNAQAANLVTQFYGLPPEVQQKVGLFYTQSLKALGVVDAENIIQAFEPPPNMGGMTPDGRIYGQAGSPGSPAPAVRGSRQVPLDAGGVGGANSASTGSI
jgi:hypothetical protein